MASKKTSTAKKRAVFKLDAPDASKVFLAGDFNGWDIQKHPMTKGKDGKWSKSLMLARGSYEYKFLVDGEWRRDPGNPEAVKNAFGSLNSVIHVE